MVLYVSECVTIKCIIPFLKSDLDVSYLLTTPVILFVRETSCGKELLALAKGETYACEFHLYTYIYDFQISYHSNLR